MQSVTSRRREFTSRATTCPEQGHRRRDQRLLDDGRSGRHRYDPNNMNARSPIGERRGSPTRGGRTVGAGRVDRLEGLGCSAALPKPDVVAGSRATAVAIGRVAAAFFALLALVKANRSAAFDLAVTLRLQRYKSPALARLMAAASWPGFPPQGQVIPPAIIGFWLLAGRPAEAMSQTAAWVAAALATGLKFLARRPRP